MNNMKYIIIVVVLFMASITAGWFMYTPAKPQDATVSSTTDIRSNSELEKAINTYSADSPPAEQFQKVSVDSAKHQDTWWYLVDAHFTDDPAQKFKIIVADLYNSADKLQVANAPFSPLPEYNISTLNVPYSMIDELNKSLGATSGE